MENNNKYFVDWSLDEKTVIQGYYNPDTHKVHVGIYEFKESYLIDINNISTIQNETVKTIWEILRKQNIIK